MIFISTSLRSLSRAASALVLLALLPHCSQTFTAPGTPTDGGPLSDGSEGDSGPVTPTGDGGGSDGSPVSVVDSGSPTKVDGGLDGGSHHADAAVDAPLPGSDAGSDGSAAVDASGENPCEQAGGTCAVNTCPAGETMSSLYCSAATIYVCCLPGDGGGANACVAAGGTCVGVFPGACDGGTLGSQSCGSGVGTECCLP